MSAGWIREVRAHDITPGLRSHQVVGDGEIDFAKCAALFHRANVAVTIEVRPGEAATVSRDRLAAMMEKG